MISQEKQNYLFEEIMKVLYTTKYDFLKIKIPLLLNSDPIEPPNPDKLFDTLGFFRSDQPSFVYLVPKAIEDYASGKTIDRNTLSEIIYIHEVAHYLHYCLRYQQDENFHIATDTYSRTIIVESFAQLVTHKSCTNLGNEYIEVFNHLKKAQSREYTLYDDKRTPLKYSYYPLEVLLDVFISIKEEEYISEIENYLSVLLGKSFEKHIKKFVSPDKKDEYEMAETLFLIGITDSNDENKYESLIFSSGYTHKKFIE